MVLYTTKIKCMIVLPPLHGVLCWLCWALHASIISYSPLSRRRGKQISTMWLQGLIIFKIPLTFFLLSSFEILPFMLSTNLSSTRDAALSKNLSTVCEKVRLSSSKSFSAENNRLLVDSNLEDFEIVSLKFCLWTERNNSFDMERNILIPVTCSCSDKQSSQYLSLLLLLSIFWFVEQCPWNGLPEVCVSCDMKQPMGFVFSLIICNLSVKGEMQRSKFFFRFTHFYIVILVSW